MPEAVQHDIVIKVFKRLAGNLHCLTEQGKMGKSLQRGTPKCGRHASAGRPSVSEEEVYALTTLLDSDRRHTIRELARETGLARMTVLHILKERMGMRKIASQWVPHDLTEMQKWLQYDAARNHLEHYEREGEAFLRHIITLDETWAKSYEPQLFNWRHYGSPQKSKVRQNPSNVKVMVILVYDCDGVILMHTVPRQQTVSVQYYCSFLEHNLRPALRKKRRHFLQNPPIILLGCMQRKLWLICSIDGAGKCCTIHHTPRT